MQEINVDVQEVRRAANELRNSMSLIREKFGVFQDIENEIEASWKSRYTRQYINCLEETEGQVRKTVVSIENVASNLEQIAYSVEKAEREIQDLMSRGAGAAGGGSAGGGGGSFGGR